MLKLDKMKKKSIIYAIIFTILALVFTVLIKIIDVKEVGPNASAVGFSTWNLAVHEMFGFNESLYKITEILGYIMFVFIAGYALVGFIQIIKRKSLFKVDRSIICLGGLMVAMLALYVLFDKLALNYRPMLLDGELEPSFPSSHTLFALCIAGGVILLNKDKFNTNKLAKIISILAMFLATFTVVGRMLSGVHWITDILGGILISAALLSIYNLILSYQNSKT